MHFGRKVMVILLLLYRPFCFMKGIELSNGLRVMVDDDLYNELNQFDWYAHRGKKTFYAHRKQNGKCIIMHRIVMKVSDNTMMIDHIDRNGLNNQKSNLRIVTHAENIRNSIVERDWHTSKFKGVYLNKLTGKWMSAVRKNNFRHRLGSFENEADAAVAYNAKAIELHGEHAVLNNIINSVDLSPR